MTYFNTYRVFFLEIPTSFLLNASRFAGQKKAADEFAFRLPLGSSDYSVLMRAILSFA